MMLQKRLDMRLERKNGTYYLRERPPLFGPLRTPQKSLVDMTRSVRRIPSCFIMRPLVIGFSAPDMDML